MAPKQKRSNRSPTVQRQQRKMDPVIDGNEDYEESREISPSSSPLRDETPMVPRASKKRAAEEDEFNSEMQKMLECFGADVSKTLTNKKKKLEQLTQNSLKSSNKKIEDIWKVQQDERKKLYDEYCRQMNTVIQQAEADIDRIKEQEEKLVTLYKQQQKLFQQTRIVYSQRLKTLTELHSQYNKGIEDLDHCHQSQQTSIQSELRKEMTMLQKKILMDTHQQEMANVRKSLQTVLFSS